MIPCCFHPTRVVIVGDRRELIKIVESKFIKFNMTFDCYDSTQKALHYINEVYQPEPFYHRYVVKKEASVAKHRRFGTNVVDTHSEIYRPQRFEQISTVVMDYDSIASEMGGYQFLEKINDPHIQKILLVGDKNKQDVNQAVYAGLIHQCISKQDPDWEEQLSEALQNAQWHYFSKLSEVFMKTINPNNVAKYAFVDPNFQTFFKAIIINHGFTEAYLCESTGSYLFLDDQAQDHGLVVNIPEQLDFWVRSGQAKGINIPLLKALKNRKKMMCYHSHFGASEPDKSHWEIYAHPANTLKGQTGTFYYAFAPNMYDIDLERILPFDEYRGNQLRRNARLQ